MAIFQANHARLRGYDFYNLALSINSEFDEIMSKRGGDNLIKTDSQTLECAFNEVSKKLFYSASSAIVLNPM